MRLDAIPIGHDPPDDVNVVVEVPIGGEPIKYEMDKAAGTLFVDRFLHTPMRYPGNYGFIPQTLGDDDDPLDVLVQVSLDDRADRGGAAPAAVPALCDEVAASTTLRLRGLMAVAPRGGDPDPAFARLREVSDGIRAAHPDATWISAGMSGDLEAAIRHGATHLRVGTAILGSRPPLR